VTLTSARSRQDALAGYPRVLRTLRASWGRGHDDMAFDLIGPTRRTYIDHHEELLFDIAARAGVRGRALDRLWKDFYDGPRFTADEARQLAREFRALHDAMQAHPELLDQSWQAQTEHYRQHFRQPRLDW